MTNFWGDVVAAALGLLCRRAFANPNCVFPMARLYSFEYGRLFLPIYIISLFAVGARLTVNAFEVGFYLSEMMREAKHPEHRVCHESNEKNAG